ncbi:hypothetical protein MCOO_42180 [Mycobacterium cookii]|uniref:Uncharacterized protein n=1 Tax=Mycobacterium cookii TaxID=1775 RepID=A0A7I7L274_9MYCO|nr:hypothetical protein MCOO_42180 [Mycobacterium cookii]
MLAIARADATIVAVAPTLEARSQLSSSVRAIAASLQDAEWLLSQYNEATTLQKWGLCSHLAEIHVEDRVSA